MTDRSASANHGTEPGDIPKKQRKSAAGRRLMRWNPSEDQLVLLCIEYISIKEGIPIPWDAIAAQINDFLTGEGIKQHLAKVRACREAEGQRVPPKVERTTRKKNEASSNVTALPKSLSSDKRSNLLWYPRNTHYKRKSNVDADTMDPSDASDDDASKNASIFIKKMDDATETDLAKGGSAPSSSKDTKDTTKKRRTSAVDKEVQNLKSDIPFNNEQMSKLRARNPVDYAEKAPEDEEQHGNMAAGSRRLSQHEVSEDEYKPTGIVDDQAPLTGSWAAPQGFANFQEPDITSSRTVSASSSHHSFLPAVSSQHDNDPQARQPIMSEALSLTDDDSQIFQNAFPTVTWTTPPLHETAFRRVQLLTEPTLDPAVAFAPGQGWTMAQNNPARFDNDDWLMNQQHWQPDPVRSLYDNFIAENAVYEAELNALRNSDTEPTDLGSFEDLITDPEDQQNASTAIEEPANHGDVTDPVTLRYDPQNMVNANAEPAHDRAFTAPFTNSEIQQNTTNINEHPVNFSGYGNPFRSPHIQQNYFSSGSMPANNGNVASEVDESGNAVARRVSNESMHVQATHHGDFTPSGIDQHHFPPNHGNRNTLANSDVRQQQSNLTGSYNHFAGAHVTQQQSLMTGMYDQEGRVIDRFNQPGFMARRIDPQQNPLMNDYNHFATGPVNQQQNIATGRYGHFEARDVIQQQSRVTGTLNQGILTVQGSAERLHQHNVAARGVTQQHVMARGTNQPQRFITENPNEQNLTDDITQGGLAAQDTDNPNPESSYHGPYATTVYGQNPNYQARGTGAGSSAGPAIEDPGRGSSNAGSYNIMGFGNASLTTGSHDSEGYGQGNVGGAGTSRTMTNTAANIDPPLSQARTMAPPTPRRAHSAIRAPRHRRRASTVVDPATSSTTSTAQNEGPPPKKKSKSGGSIGNLDPAHFDDSEYDHEDKNPDVQLFSQHMDSMK